MPILQTQVKIHAPLEEVAAFHHSTQALKRLTPPPIFVQLHTIEPLAEGSQSDFTLWFGPLPIRWLAVHTQVNPRKGFVDTQKRGVMRRWQHTHHWQALDATHILLTDRVVYEHERGAKGLLTRLLFARPLLRFMFAYRHWITRRTLEKPSKR